ncbi:MAG: transposase family protein, partial [Chlamydiae bacterium]|nr:transposase family protein [Chlamydiota bacterium]
MGKYETVVKLSAEEFRRLTGIKMATFQEMIEILKKAEAEKKAIGGKPNKLSMEDRLLMTLEYLREYRTYFHVSQSYGVSESVCWRNCKWVEDALIRSRKFSLPGKKALLKSDNEFEVILVDAAESPIERP